MYFALCDRPPELSEDINMFAATTGLAYPMRIALVSLVRPIRTMQQITEHSEQKVRIPFEMTVRATHQGVCHELYKLVCKMAKEVDLWQERFDLLLDATLCEDCIEKKDGCISPPITKQPETAIQVKNVIWEAVNIRVRLRTLTICIRKMMTHWFL